MLHITNVHGHAYTTCYAHAHTHTHTWLTGVQWAVQCGGAQSSSEIRTTTPQTRVGQLINVGYCSVGHCSVITWLNAITPAPTATMSRIHMRYWRVWLIVWMMWWINCSRKGIWRDWKGLGSQTSGKPPSSGIRPQETRWTMPFVRCVRTRGALALFLGPTQLPSLEVEVEHFSWNCIWRRTGNM